MSNVMLAILLLPACLEEIDLSNPDAAALAAVISDDDALREVCSPAIYPEQGLAMAVQANMDECRKDPRYARGLLRTWSNIIKETDDPLTVDEVTKLTQARAMSGMIFTMGPSIHWRNGESVITFFNVPKARASVKKTEIDIAEAILDDIFGNRLVLDIARHYRELAANRPEKVNDRAVVGELPTEIQDALVSDDDLNLVRVVALHKGGNLMVASDVRAPAQPMPHRMGKGKDAQNIGDFVPKSREIVTKADGTVVNGNGFPLALGWRFDAFRYPSPDEVAAKARELGLTSLAKSVKDTAAATIEVEDPEDETEATS